MRQIHIISIGKLSRNFQNIAEEYEKMIKCQLRFTEISYKKKLPPSQIKPFEASKILEYLTPKSYKIALDALGKPLTSYELTDIFKMDKNVDFIIGGAFGLDKAVLDIADLQLSLSIMTFPHQLVKVILLEQIYRSQTILDNHPYHK